MVADALPTHPALQTCAQTTLQTLQTLQNLMQERVGYSAAPDLQNLHNVFIALQSIMPANEFNQAHVLNESIQDATPSQQAAALIKNHKPIKNNDSLQTRDDALRAIDKLCEYLERTEPTNPAQWLLRRAKYLMTKNFMELVKDLAPQALEDISRVMGVRAEDISSSSNY
jgi:type VI secretion system protein ImpA